MDVYIDMYLIKYFWIDFIINLFKYFLRIYFIKIIVLFLYEINVERFYKMLIYVYNYILENLMFINIYKKI